MNARPSWDRYFMDIAHVVASRGTCLRKQVGCVVVSPDQRILATGFNGSMPGNPHCTDEGCLMDGGHCIRTNHAEMNAVSNKTAVWYGATAYVTVQPCWTCFKMLVHAGVMYVVYGEAYGPLYPPAPANAKWNLRRLDD